MLYLSEDDVILLVENERDYASLVKDALSCARILNPVYAVESGEDAVAYLNGKLCLVASDCYCFALGDPIVTFCL